MKSAYGTIISFWFRSSNHVLYSTFLAIVPQSYLSWSWGCISPHLQACIYPSYCYLDQVPRKTWQTLTNFVDDAIRVADDELCLATCAHVHFLGTCRFRFLTRDCVCFCLMICFQHVCKAWKKLGRQNFSFDCTIPLEHSANTSNLQVPIAGAPNKSFKICIFDLTVRC